MGPKPSGPFRLPDGVARGAVQLPGWRMAVLLAPSRASDREAGLPIVALHGWLAAKELWCPVLTDLSAGHLVVALDLPGFGHSSPLPGRRCTPDDLAAAVRGACRVLGLDRIALVGHSLGAVVALSIALADPALVARLVLASPPTPAALRRNARPVLGPTGRPLTSALHTLSRADARLVAAADALPRRPSAGPDRDRFSWRRRALAARSHPSVLVGSLRALPDAPAFGRLHEVAMPTLLVAGERDRTTPGADADRIAAAIPDALVEILPGLRHHTMLEDPAAFAAAVLDWLDS